MLLIFYPIPLQPEKKRIFQSAIGYITAPTSLFTQLLLGLFTFLSFSELKTTLFQKGNINR